jgi:hypothetical protein
VAYVSDFLFLKNDYTLWLWDSNNPTPKQMLENVAVLADSHMHLQNGNVIAIETGHHRWLYYLERGIGSFGIDGFENVKIPRTIAFE